MSWLGKSFGNLKDQISTLTREVLAEADEDSEQPKYIQVEKFDRLLKICEEKEEQICQLQRENDALRCQLPQQTFSETTEKVEISNCANFGRDDGGCDEGNSSVCNIPRRKETKLYPNQNEDEKSNPEESNNDVECSPSIGNDDANSDEKQIQHALRRIESISGKNRLEHLQFILKEVKQMYLAEKLQRSSNESGCPSSGDNRMKPSISVISFPSSKNSNGTGTDETMSNDSERSDDSLLHDFEILKSRDSCKSLEEFAISNSGGTVSTRVTNSAFSQSNYEFSVVEKSTQTCSNNAKSDVDVEMDVVVSVVPSAICSSCMKKGKEFEQIFHLIENNSLNWRKVFDRINSVTHGSNEDDNCEERNLFSSQQPFWIELGETVSENNDTLKHLVTALINENVLWEEFYQSLQENEENTKRRVDRLLERELSLEESIRLKNTAIVKHVNELNTYSKKLEDFNHSLNEVSDEILDQTTQFNSLYEELKVLKKNKEGLENENARLIALVKNLETSIAPKQKEELPNMAPTGVSEQLELEKEVKDTSRYKDPLTDHVRLTNQLRLCADEIDSFKNESAEWQNFCEVARKECLAKNDEIARLTEQAELFKNETEFLTSNMVDVQTHCECLREEVTVKDEHISTVVNENVRFEEEIRSLQNRIAQLEADYLQSENEVSLVRTAEQSNQTDYDNSNEQEKIRYLTNQVEELTMCKAKLEEEVALSSQRVRELTEQIESYESNIETYKLYLKERTEECAVTDEKLRLLSERSTELDNEVFLLKNQLVELEKSLEDAQKEIISKETHIAELTRRNSENSDEIERFRSTLRVQDDRRWTLKRNLSNILLSEDESVVRRLPDIIRAVENFASLAEEQKKHLLLSSENENENSKEVDDWYNLIERAQALSSIPNEVEKSNMEKAMTELDSQLQFHKQKCAELQARISELESSLVTEADCRETLKNSVRDLEKKLGVVTSERDQVITSLKEKHSENLYYHNELQKVHALLITEVEKNKDHIQQIEELKQQLINNNNAETELQRLREHLLSMEQSYTNELLLCEEHITGLKYKLNEYEDQIKSMNAVQTSVNVRANQITESLQKEAKILMEEKEKLTATLKHCQGELQKSTHDAQNLRSALDLFHRNKESEIFQATEKLQTKIEALQNENRMLNETISTLQNNLDIVKQSSNEKIELREQIERKTRTINELGGQVDALRKALSQAEVKIADLKANAENTFKLNLLKNIVLRYITSNTDSMRSQALQILAEVLDFSVEEKQKLKLPAYGGNDRSKTKSSSSNQSLIDEFIRFMEKESDPKDRSASEKKTNISPNILFASPSSLPDIMLPTLSQHPVGQNSRHILKDVLQ